MAEPTSPDRLEFVSQFRKVDTAGKGLITNEQAIAHYSAVFTELDKNGGRHPKPVTPADSRAAASDASVPPIVDDHTNHRTAPLYSAQVIRRGTPHVCAAGAGNRGRVMSMYHDGNRELQDRFSSRALADRLVERLWRDRFKEEDKAFIESVGFFFLATADHEGQPDCSFKGGPPGFVKVPSPDLLIFPDYDGNGMFKSLGNIKINSQVGLLFMTMGEKPQRLRVNGRASLHFDDPTMDDLPGAHLVVRIVPEHIFPNCPRYIPNLQTGEPSQYLPCEGVAPKEPAWKNFDSFKDVVPPRRR